MRILIVTEVTKLREIRNTEKQIPCPKNNEGSVDTLVNSHFAEKKFILPTKKLTDEATVNFDLRWWEGPQR